MALTMSQQGLQPVSPSDTRFRHVYRRRGTPSSDLLLSDDTLDQAASNLRLEAFHWARSEEAPDQCSARMPDDSWTALDLPVTSGAHNAEAERPALRLTTAYELRGDANELLQRKLGNSGLILNERVTALEILEEIRNAGYDVFVAGGLVRDALLLEEREDADIDIAGTVPFSALDEIVRNVRLESHELWAEPNPRGTVARIQATGAADGSTTVAEYAPLKRYFRQGKYWFDHDLSYDARWRDLAFNTLFYDAFMYYIFDPTGKGLADLGWSATASSSPTLRPVFSPEWMDTHDDEELEELRKLETWILFRILKFVMRYADRGPGLDVAATWVCKEFEACRTYLASLPSPASVSNPYTSDVYKAFVKAYSSSGALRRDKDNDWQKLKAACVTLEKACNSGATSGNLLIWDGLRRVLDG